MAPFTSQLQRTFWVVKDLEVYRSNEAFDPYPSGMEVCEKAHPSVANTIASLLKGEGGMHAPCIDIDWQAYAYSEDDRQVLEVVCAWPKVLEDVEYRQLRGMVPTTTDEVAAICTHLRRFPFVQHVLFSGQEGRSVRYVLYLEKSAHVMLLSSKSRGHFHCYIEEVMEWREYIKFVRLLNRLGIVQDGFYAMTQRRQMSHLRKPNSEVFVQQVERAGQKA